MENYERLLKTITGLGSPKVLLAGDFMLDVYTFGDALRISPEAPVPVLRVRRTERSCGGAASVAADLAALGAKPVCVGVVGEDANGESLKAMLEERGADISGVLTVGDRPTICKQRLIGLAQHRHQQQLFRMDEESTEPLGEADKRRILEFYEERVGGADIVCLQDYNKGLLGADICEQMIKSARAAGKRVLVDPSPTSDYTKYARASVITPNRQEASIAVGFEVEDTQAAARAAERLMETLDLEAVVITLDKEGAFLRTDKLSKAVPTRARNVYDVTGAGDMVLATIAAVLAAGADFMTAVQLANIAGGLEVEKFGVATVSVEEIVNEIISVNHGREGKVRTVESLKAELAWERRQGRKVVFTNGCFDVIHRGHIEFMRFCKGQGEVLVVGLNSDESVRALKGVGRPINNEHDRAAVLAELESVDYVTVFEETEPLRLIKEVEPDVLVKGRDWAEKGVVGREFVEGRGGKVVLAPLVEGKSSTGIIEKVRALASKISKHKTVETGAE